MTIADSMLPEFDHEMRVTRTLIEQVPDDRGGWQPHAKSMTMGRLAMHLPELVGMIPSILQQSELDYLAAAKPGAWTTTAAALVTFDAAVARARPLIEAEGDAAFMETWTFKAGTQVIVAVPRVVALRSFVMNHVIHHRGQLSVYLRLNDIKLPEIYGPNADSTR